MINSIILDMPVFQVTLKNFAERILKEFSKNGQYFAIKKHLKYVGIRWKARKNRNVLRGV